MGLLMRVTLDSLLIRNPDVFQVGLGDGTIVLLGVDDLNYLALGDTGSFIWGQLETTASLRSVCDALMDEFEVDEHTCVAETTAFIEMLHTHGVVRIAGETSVD